MYKGVMTVRMSIPKMRKILEDRLTSDDRTITYRRKNEELRIELKETKQGITVSLPQTISKWEQLKEKAIDEVVYYVNETLQAYQKKVSLTGNEKNIFPVIRSASFPKKTKGDIPLVRDEHTVETAIYYALDLGNTYRLIDEKMLEEAAWNKQQLREMAMFNLRSLDQPLKKDTVAGNDFYFLNTNDGYDASRILNESFMKKMREKITGDMVISIPHGDVLIIADIQNKRGYEVLSQINMDFFTKGLIPITPLSFVYKNDKLEPIFIMVHAKPKPRKE